jgi:hypothetical protein
MAKNKTAETTVSVVDFINSFVESEQKKADSFLLIELMNGRVLSPKCGALLS